MTDTAAGWARLFETVRKDRQVEYLLAMLASEGGMLFGKPFQVQFSWPTGLPLHLESDDELRRFARERLQHDG